MSATTVTVDVEQGPLCAPLLQRAVASMAARAGLTLDRVDDAALLVDALVAHAGPKALSVRIEAGEGELGILAGPFRRERARELVAERPLPDAEALLVTLADASRVREASSDTVYVRLQLSAR